MALSSAKTRIITGDNLQYHAYPVSASRTIYKGGAISHESSGCVDALAGGEPFAGFADQNAVGGTSNGDVRCMAVVQGYIHGVAITGATGFINLIPPNNDVYMSDDDTFTLTISGNTKIGHIADYDPVSGLFTVRFTASNLRANT